MGRFLRLTAIRMSRFGLHLTITNARQLFSSIESAGLSVRLLRSSLADELARTQILNSKMADQQTTNVARLRLSLRMLKLLRLPSQQQADADRIIRDLERLLEKMKSNPA